jgi:hypothetical protein
MGILKQFKGSSHHTTSTTLPLCTAVPVPSQESERQCMFVIRVAIIPLCTLFVLDFGTVPTL